ncbi:MAG: polyisoprenoid-binding protein [Deltaproteobacteria bacterium]|nr:polyisoprenoid-binding protein [Deltaproteobacteria bacterium]
MATWKIDPSHTVVQFTVRHLVISKVKGRFTKFEGGIEFDPSAPAAGGKVEVKIDPASIDTGEPKRDGHLRSPDFFDVEKFPALTFKSTSFAAKGGGHYAIAGDLTIHGVTKPVELTTEYLGAGKDPWGGQRVGFSAHTAIDRKDFGLTWNQALEAGGVLVGDKINIELEVQAVAA